MSSRLILWDFDGTLADTLLLALTVYNKLATEHGFKTINDTESVRNQSMQQFLQSHRVPTWRVPGLFAHFLTSMSDTVGTARLFPGMTDVLRELKTTGYRQGIISSNAKTNIQQCLAHNGAGDLFDDVCGTSKLFGKERRIRAALGQFGVSTDRCLYIGDEIRDVEAGRASGVAVGCVSWGLNAPCILSQQSPVFTAETSQDLPRLISHHFLSR